MIFFMLRLDSALNVKWNKHLWMDWNIMLCYVMQFFRVYIASPKHKEGWENSKTVMQTRDVVQGLHNFRQFSQLSEC